MRRGGDITDEIQPGTGVFACMLGGADGRTLFACTAPDFAEEGIALLFASRDGHDLAGLPELALGGLDDDAARALLVQSAPGLDAWERMRVLRESHGVPLALRELGRAARDSGESLLAR